MTYVIRETTHFYAPQADQRNLVEGDDNHAMIFDTRAEADAWIKDHDESVYYTSHNESGRPSHKILRMDSLPAYLNQQL